MELRLPAVQGAILLIRSLAVQPRSLLAFFSPLHSASSSLTLGMVPTVTGISDASPPPPPSGFALT